MEPVNIEAEPVSTSELAGQMVPVGDLSALEQRIECELKAYRRILGLAIANTHSGDWANLGGKPYLMSQGAERIARPFGVWISKPQTWREDREDAKGKYYIYFCLATVGSKLLDAHMDIEGSCDSRDQFFAMSGGKLKPIEDVSEKNIRKKAYTNMFINGVTRLLGMRQLTWAFLEANGIKRGETAKVEYGGKGAKETITEGAQKILDAKLKAKVSQGAAQEIIMKDFQTEFGVTEFKDLPRAKMNDAIAYLDGIKI